ncbi:MAG: metallophosphoesterase [Thermotogota bacterium]|nr:metallophosphoesterase [Thermotogota bacterium]
MNLLHISDLHIHRDQEKNKNTRLRLEKIMSMFPDDLLITTGDITDDGHPKQYKNAKDLPGLKVPGNHDYGYAGNIYDREKAELFDKIFGTCFADINIPHIKIINNIQFVGLDSNLETEHPFDFACGEIGPLQLRLLGKTLQNKIPTVVYLHHHPFVRNDPFMELRDARKFMRTIYGRVDVLLFGHRHVEQIWHDTCGIKLIHAAGRLADSDHVLKITINDGEVGSEYVEI